MSEIPAHTVRTADVLANFAPGSFDPPWTWDDEAHWLNERICRATGLRGGYQIRLEAWLREKGRIDQPICLGSDGRVWDGHHRIVAAIRLGLDTIPAECFCGTDNTCPAAEYETNPTGPHPEDT